VPCEQVHDYLFEACTIPFHGYSRSGFAGDAQLLVFGQPTHLLGGGRVELGEIEAHPLGVRLARIQA
jgi:hypothetical protein